MPESFIAHIELAKSDDGGRAGRLASGQWRTVLGINNEYWSARMFFVGEPSPGEVFQASVQLLMPEAGQYFPIGAEFTVWENGTKGIGRVLSYSSLLQP